jgi:hypothetical protein
MVLERRSIPLPMKKRKPRKKRFKPPNRWVDPAHTLEQARARLKWLGGLIAAGYLLHLAGVWWQMRYDSFWSRLAAIFVLIGIAAFFVEGKHYRTLLKRRTSDWIIVPAFVLALVFAFVSFVLIGELGSYRKARELQRHGIYRPAVVLHERTPRRGRHVYMIRYFVRDIRYEETVPIGRNRFRTGDTVAIRCSERDPDVVELAGGQLWRDFRPPADHGTGR